MDVPPVFGPVRVLWEARATLGEGALWSAREQALWWVDILQHRLHRFRPADGERRSWTLPDTVSAVAERRHAAGLLLALRYGPAFFNPASGALEQLTPPVPPLRPSERFNDGACDAQGRFWCGSMDFACREPHGALYRLETSLAFESVWDAGFAVTNGPAWTLDGGTLFFNDTVRRRVMAAPFDPTSGRLGTAVEFLRLARGDGLPDGMTVDAAGRLWLAHWGGGCITAHDPRDGAELARVTLPVPQITKMAFGGPDLRTLFVTSARDGLDENALLQYPLSGALFALDTSVQGRLAPTFDG